jgi:hypothetical protein
MSPLYIGIIIAGVGLVLAAGGFYTRRKAGRILSAPLRKTGEAAGANGITSCEGVVRTGQPLTAPCTNTPCVYYRLKIEKKVKEKKGGQTTTSWKKVMDQHYGSVFALDDGSGPVAVHAQDELDGDLEQSFSGAPPGGPGLGALTNFVPNTVRSASGEEVLEYRAIEKLIRVDARLFALGSAQAGQLTKPGTGKLMVSTRGRDAIVGSTKRLAMILLAAGGLATAGGATVAVLRPGEARACGALKDGQKECRVRSNTIVELERPQADGSKKLDKVRKEVLAWHVTKPIKFELSARDPKKGRANPSIQVENSVGLPMNIDFGLAIGAGAFSTKTKTMTLIPGDYSIYVWSSKDGPSDLLLQITELADK